MRKTTLAILISLPCVLACDKSAKNAAPSDQETGHGIEINAPGVEVKVDPKQGVEVKTPAVDVETERGGDTDVKVDRGEPK